MDTRLPLTHRQSQILDAIRVSMRERGHPPTTRELADTVGLSSSSSVVHQIQVLEARGWITRGPRNQRTITVHDDPEPDDMLRLACRELINASLNRATTDDVHADGRLARAWDTMALALDKAEDAHR